MPEELGAKSAADRPNTAGEAPAHGGFLKTLPGIITAATGLVVAIGGLLTVLGQTGIVGARTGVPTETPTRAAPLPTATTPAAAASGNEADVVAVEEAEPTAPMRDRLRTTRLMASEAQDVTYYVRPTSDGWAAARAAPTVASALVAKLVGGTHVRCGRELVEDAGGDETRRWRHCPEVGGYISARLVLPVES